MVNPHNFRPVFTQEQLTTSIQATYLITPSLRAALIMDIDQLHIDIRSALQMDPVGSAQLAKPEG